jgi:hypothetical protein
MKIFRTAALVAAFLALAAAFAFTADDDAKEGAKQAPAVSRPFFGNAKCPLTGRATKPDVFLEKNGERVHFCCTDCKGKAEADVDAALAKAYPVAEVKAHDNKTCPVMGDAIDPADHQVMTVQGHSLKLCCKGCDRKARKATNHVLAMIADPTLVPLRNTRCPVSGETANGQSIVVVDGVLISLCCEKCAARMEKEAATILEEAKIDLAEVKKAAAQKP